MSQLLLFLIPANVGPMLTLTNILPWVQLVVSVALIGLILFQRNEAGLDAAFGGSGGSSVAHTKRGLEKTFFIATIILAVLFVVTAILSLLI